MMAVTFGYEFAVVKPEIGEIVKGSLIPWCADCDSKVLLQAVGIVGAVIMPHNLYLHSALVKSRNIDRKNVAKVKEANYYFFIEAAIALFISFIINVFVVSVFAHGLFGKTNEEIVAGCVNETSIYDEAKLMFNGTEVEADIYRGGIFLGNHIDTPCAKVSLYNVFSAFRLFIRSCGDVTDIEITQPQLSNIFALGTFGLLEFSQPDSLPP